MKRRLLLFIAILASLSLRAGTYAGDFMAIGGGVRSISMGGAFCAVADDATALYWNTSGISNIERSTLHAMHAFLYNGLASYDNFIYVQPLPNAAAIGINWTRLTVSDIPHFSEKYLVGTNVDQRVSDPSLFLPGTPESTFKSTDDLFQFGFSKHIHLDLDMGWKFSNLPVDLYAGGNVKFIRRMMFGKYGTGTGCDLSYLVAINLSELSGIKNLGTFKQGMNFMDISNTTIKWDTESEHKDEILMNTKYGISYEQPLTFIKSTILLAVDKDLVYDQKCHYGVEYVYDSFLAVRSGYYRDNYSAGLGLELYDFKLDYAFVANDLGNTNRISLGFSF